MKLGTYKLQVERICILAIISSMVMIIGCAPGNVQVKGMIPGQINVLERQSGTVDLQVEGGQDKHVMGLPAIPNADFMNALKKAIENSGVFPQVVDKGGAQYHLEAFIFNLRQPIFVSGDVSLEVAWTLERKDTGEVIWQEAITTVDSGADEYSGGYNKRVATEKAVLKNIKRAIEELSKTKYKL